MPNLPNCSVDGCANLVSKAGFKLCLEHWKDENKKPKTDIKKAETEKSTTLFLNSTQLGDHLGIDAKKVNQVLLELGWIERSLKGWLPTQQGKKLQAQSLEYHKTGVPFITWPEGILTSAILKRAVEEYSGATSSASEVATTKPIEHEYTLSFRSKFPAKYRTSDGHQVRSRAELAIDNWLYHNSVFHVYEKKLPIEEEVYSDFYIRDGNVYIEYWGMEKDQKYLARKAAKKEIYLKNEFKLIELDDKHIENLDDYLPKFLLKYGVAVD
jgi:hypothetical protein